MKIKLTRLIRYGVLAAVLIYVMVNAYIHIHLGGQVAPNVHALCPYGAIESAYSFFSSGTLIQKVFVGTFVLFGLTLILALFFRRAFCGYICPFGALQEFFSIIGQKIFKKRFTLNEKLDRPFRWLKYFILIFTAVMAWQVGGLFIAPYDPYSALAHIYNLDEIMNEALIGLILLVITIIGSIAYDRFFCKYLCPAGAFYGIVSKVGLSKIKRDESMCIKCKKCSKVCPVNIKVEELKEVNSAECINCNECITSCPKVGAIDVETVGNKRINTSFYMVFVFIIFFGGIAISNFMGIYIVKNEPIKKGELVKTEEGQTIYDVSSLKGSNTLLDIIKGMNISKEKLYALLGLDKEVPTTTLLKHVQKYVPGITPEIIRDKLENWRGE